MKTQSLFIYRSRMKFKDAATNLDALLVKIF